MTRPAKTGQTHWKTVIVRNGRTPGWESTQQISSACIQAQGAQ